MAKLLKLRRGTTSQHSSFTGAEGEVTVDTTKDTLVVHDGSTAGGVPLAKESDNLSLIDEDNMSTNSATRPPSQQSVKAYVDALPDVIDEDNMASDSATRPPSQQSVKAYVDAIPDVIDEDDMATNSATRPPSQQSVKAYAAPKAAPAFTGTATGVNLTLSGNLTVNGTTTTVASTTLDVADKNIELGKVSTPTDTTADGGGITLKGATDKEIKWLDASDSWTFNQNIEITSGTLTVKGTEGVSAGLYLIADEGDDNGDGWRLNSNQDDNDLTFANDTSGSYVDKLTLQNDGDLYTTSDVYLKDGKKLILGDGSDVNLKHQSGHFEINNTTGNTYLQSYGEFRLRGTDSGSTKEIIYGTPGAQVELYYNNGKTLTTTANGITIFDDGKDDEARLIVQGGEASGATIFLYADDGDDNADKWRVGADTSGNFKVANYSTGSWVDGLTLDGSNNATFAGTVSDSKGDLRKIIQNTQGSAYTLVAADAGKHILASGNITVPDSVFAAGDAITIINNTGSNLTITKGTNLYNTGDGTNANRTLATRGMVTLLFTAADTAYISGAGLS